VPTTTRSTSAAATPARSSACCPARTARSEVAQSSGAYQRVVIPDTAAVFSMKSGKLSLNRSASVVFVSSIVGT